MMELSIASAVVLPEPESPPRAASPPVPQKRRQSSVSEQDNKRQRLDSIDAKGNLDRRSSTNGNSTAAPPQARRERGRERRLFGAVLGALSQNPASTAQNRRSEIEKRQKAQRELEDKETDQRKLERDVQRRAQRQREQKRFEEESMRIRHDNLRHMARFLKTKAQPSLYYLPWEMASDEEDIIQDQCDQAEDIIRREREDYYGSPIEEGERERHASRKIDADVEMGDTGANSPIGKEHENTPQDQPTAHGTTNGSDPLPKDPELREDHAEDDTNHEAVNGDQADVQSQPTAPAIYEAAADDDNSKDLDDIGEEVVEAGEDTVIY